MVLFQFEGDGVFASHLIANWSIILWPMGLMLICSFIICHVLIYLSRFSSRLSGRAHDLRAVQSMHSRMTPRVGGLAIFTALLLSLAFVPSIFFADYLRFILASFVLFGTGLLEDLGFAVSPRRRLVAAGIASLLVIFMLGFGLPRLGVPVLDPYMAHWAVFVPVTLLVTAGVSNGFNLIDGVNGLAGFVAVVSAFALAAIAHSSGHVAISHLSLMLISATIGFLLVNYPHGRIFLGDAGAYTLGFVLSWFGIFILSAAPQASPFAVLLTVFWPVADTMLAIYRRALSKADVSAPDRLHVHQMVMRTLEITVLGRRRRHIANPLTTLILAPFILAPPIAGVLLWDQNFSACLAVIFFGGLFFASYALTPALVKAYRR